LHGVLAEKVAGHARLGIEQRTKVTSARMRGCLRVRRDERGMDARQGKGWRE
jgi:hypothetical protein